MSITLEQDPAFSLALAVIGQRLRELPEDDRESLVELLPAMFGVDDEERESALRAMREILAPPQGRIVDLPPRRGSSEWLKFISAKIREAREDAGMTQDELAERTGIQQSHISRLEKAEHSPTAKTRQKIALALGLDASAFEAS